MLGPTGTCARNTTQGKQRLFILSIEFLQEARNVLNLRDKCLQRLPLTRDLSPSKESGRSCVLVDVNQRKAVEIIFNSDNISRQQNQGIESFID